MLNFFKNLGTVEIIIIALAILLLFGGRKLNELAKGLGESKKEFQNIKKEIKVSKKSKKENQEDSLT